MFVRRDKYREALKLAAANKAKYEEMVTTWNALVRKINAHGGEGLFTRYAPQFTQEEIKSLIRLCHPDKHNDSPAANDLTAKLLKMRI